MTNEHPIARWHRIVRERDAAGLGELLADEVVFFSPVVHAPQQGKPIVSAYLGAALKVLGGSAFRYVREIVGDGNAMLEFETQIGDVIVNGVDIIRWNDAGRIVEFKVMVRPLKAINAVHEAMAAMLRR